MHGQGSRTQRPRPRASGSTTTKTAAATTSSPRSWTLKRLISFFSFLSRLVLFSPSLRGSGRGAKHGRRELNSAHDVVGGGMGLQLTRRRRQLPQPRLDWVWQELDPAVSVVSLVAAVGHREARLLARRHMIEKKEGIGKDRSNRIFAFHVGRWISVFYPTRY